MRLYKVIHIKNLQNVKKLALIFVQALYLNVKERCGIDIYAVFLGDVNREVLLIVKLNFVKLI